MSDRFHEIFRTLQRRAASDETFRRRLLEDARGALRELGLDLPAEIEVEVLEEKADKLYVVLPHVSGSDELADEELERAAGGLFSFGTRLSGGGTVAISIP